MGKKSKKTPKISSSSHIHLLACLLPAMHAFVFYADSVTVSVTLSN